MTFVEFKKYLLDADISLPKFAKLIKVSEKNLQNCKKKGEVPNAIASVVACFVAMEKKGINYNNVIDKLHLEQKTKKGAGFATKSDKKRN